jgi:hypothetical protein
VVPNPAAADITSEFQLRTVPFGDSAPEIVHRQLMSTARSEAKVDVADVDALDLYVDETYIFTVPRNFWQGRSRGRLVMRLQPGGVSLIRSVEPTGNSRTCAGSDEDMTCWSTETWYFPGGFWDGGSAVAVPLLVRNKSNLEAGAALAVQIFADEPTWTLLAEHTFIGGATPRWEVTAQLDPEATLTVVVGDQYVEIPPDVWQVIWKSVTLEVTDEAVTFESHWPNSARTLGRVTEELPLVPLP